MSNYRIKSQDEQWLSLFLHIDFYHTILQDHSDHSQLTFYQFQF